MPAVILASPGALLPFVCLMASTISCCVMMCPRFISMVKPMSSMGAPSSAHLSSWSSSVVSTFPVLSFTTVILLVKSTVYAVLESAPSASCCCSLGLRCQVACELCLVFPCTPLHFSVFPPIDLQCYCSLVRFPCVWLSWLFSVATLCQRSIFFFLFFCSPEQYSWYPHMIYALSHKGHLLVCPPKPGTCSSAPRKTGF